MNESLNVKGQQEIENIMFSCGMSLSTNLLYTARYISCSSAIDNAYLSSAFRKRLEDGVSYQSSISNEAANGPSSANFVVEIKGTPPPEKQKCQLKFTSWAKANEGSATKSVNLKRKGNGDLCRICGAHEPSGKTKITE